jgi:hypothetical protein
MVTSVEKLELARKILINQGGTDYASFDKTERMAHAYSREELRKMLRASRKPKRKQPRDPKTQRWQGHGQA